MFSLLWLLRFVHHKMPRCIAAPASCNGAQWSRPEINSRGPRLTVDKVSHVSPTLYPFSTQTLQRLSKAPFFLLGFYHWLGRLPASRLHHLFPTIQLFEPYKILLQRFDSIGISAQICQHLLRTQQRRLVGTTDGLLRAQNRLAASISGRICTPKKKTQHETKSKNTNSLWESWKLGLIINRAAFCWRKSLLASIRCKSSTAYKAFCRLSGSSSARRFLRFLRHPGSPAGKSAFFVAVKCGSL